MKTPSQNPPMTLPEGPPLAEVPESWTGVYCKPRQEKALAWDLCRQDVPYFLPMIPRSSYSRGRRRTALIPMFASYLFYAGDDDQRLKVLKTERVVTMVDIHENQQDKFRSEITSLEIGLRTAPDSIELYPRLVEGAWVRVVGGPMAGAEGVILKADKKGRGDDKAKLLLGVTLMGAGATVEIHPDLIEPCERPDSLDARKPVEVVYDLKRRQPKSRR